MRQTTTAELCLDHGKRRVLDSRTGTPAVWLRTEAVAIEFGCGAPRRDGQSAGNPGDVSLFQALMKTTLSSDLLRSCKMVPRNQRRKLVELAP
jgi:hypothetical protein